MAYRKFAGADDLLLNPESSPEPPSRPTSDPRFTREEWSVIDLAERDGIWSLHAESRFGRAMRWLFGIEAGRPLANSRLESLRRFAVRAWRRQTIGRSALEEFAAAGFSPSHADILIQNVARRRRAQQWPKGLA